MPKYIIEREIPNAAALSSADLQAIAQRSATRVRVISIGERDMTLHVRTLVSIAALAALAACSSDSPLRPSPSTAPEATMGGNGLSMRLAHAKVCPSSAPGVARCHSW